MDDPIGGVLELEPSEAEQTPIPFFLNTQLDLEELDRLEHAGQINTILNITDRALLQDKMGMDKNEIEMLRSAWRKLSGRRIGRKIKAAKAERFEKFPIQVETAYVSRYKGLPPHAA